MRALASLAIAFGFSHAGALDASTLEARGDVREMCREDKCGRFGKNWMCPPMCGSLEENAGVMSRYSAGIIVQTTGELEDDFDYEGMLEAERRQKRLFASFRDELAREYPDMLALGNGACDLCETCPCPGEPCRDPARAVSSMEAFGLFVSDVCEKNGLGYYYGPGTITYTGCYLLL
jgi:predicted metal-binding protein